MCYSGNKYIITYLDANMIEDPFHLINKDDIMCYSMKVQKDVCGGCSFICFWALPAASLCQRSCHTLTDWNFDGKHC